MPLFAFPRAKSTRPVLPEITQTEDEGGAFTLVNTAITRCDVKSRLSERVRFRMAAGVRLRRGDGRHPKRRSVTMP
jgi:hypothetical protein